MACLLVCFEPSQSSAQSILVANGIDHNRIRAFGMGSDAVGRRVRVEFLTDVVEDCEEPEYGGPPYAVRCAECYAAPPSPTRRYPYTEETGRIPVVHAWLRGVNE